MMRELDFFLQMFTALRAVVSKSVYESSRIASAADVRSLLPESLDARLANLLSQVRSKQSPSRADSQTLTLDSIVVSILKQICLPGV